MSRVSQNAFKGYSFQKAFLTFLVLQYDKTKKFKTIYAEKSANDNFDDIEINLDTEKIRIQTKNIEKINKITIEENYINLNSSKIILSNNAINILVLKKTDDNLPFEINDEIFGLKAHKNNRLYIIHVDIDELWNVIEETHNDNNRIIQIIKFADIKSTEKSLVINCLDLPSYSFFPHSLSEETINIRNYVIESNESLYYIVGKPGVGKSHLVNEILTENCILYRFWIGEHDNHINERLLYSRFIIEIIHKIFDDDNEHSVNDIIKRLKTLNKVLIIDGLDHVENYNKKDLEKFINFIDKFNDSEGAKIIILSRPLTINIEWETHELQNWKDVETEKYLEDKHNLIEYEIVRKIYKIGKGYPIITEFLANHYMLHKEIPDYTEITDLFDYYDELTESIGMVNCLSIFITNTSFFTFKELKHILGDYHYKTIKQFIDKYKYLFDIRLNRISLIHDSLNTYLYKKADYHSIENDVINFVVNSILDEQINFLDRITCFKIDFKNQKRIVLKYINFELFRKMLSSYHDVESILNFYNKLLKFISNLESTDLSVYQYYDYTLILNIITRDNITGHYNLILNHLFYLNNYVRIEDVIYSNSLIFHILYSLKMNDITLFNNYFEHNDSEAERLYDAYQNNSDFFKYDSSDEHVSFLLGKVKNIKKYVDIDRKRAMIELFVIIFLYDLDIPVYTRILKIFLNGDEETSTNELIEYCLTIDIGKTFSRKILHQVKDKLHRIGELSEDNEFLNLEFDDFIESHSKFGSFVLSEDISDYLRLCNKKQRKIDILKINKYYVMYHMRKDYTVINMSEALFIFKELSIISNIDSVNIISSAQLRSEKGIRHILYEYLNKLDEEEFHTIEEMGIFEEKSDYNVSLSDCKPEILNYLNENLVFKNLIKDLNRPSRTVDYKEHINVLNSNHRNILIKICEYNNLEIYNVPKTENIIDFKAVKYSLENNSEEEYILGERFKSGYLDIRDREFINKMGIPLEKIVVMLDGWFDKFSDVDIYNIYDNDIIKEKLLNILHMSIY